MWAGMPLPSKWLLVSRAPARVICYYCHTWAVLRLEECFKIYLGILKINIPIIEAKKRNPSLAYRLEANWSILPWTWERHLKLAVALPLSLSTRPAGNFSIEFVTAALRLVPHTHTYPDITLWSWGWWNRHRQLIHISGQHKFDWQNQSRCNNFGI